MNEPARAVLVGYVARDGLRASGLLTGVAVAVAVVATELSLQSVAFCVAIDEGGSSLLAFTMTPTGTRTGGEGRGGAPDADDPERFLADASAPYRTRAGFALAGVATYALVHFLTLGALDRLLSRAVHVVLLGRPVLVVPGRRRLDTDTRRRRARAH